VNASLESIILGEGQDVRFFKSHDIKHLRIGFEFDLILNEYFLTQDHSR